MEESDEVSHSRMWILEFLEAEAERSSEEAGERVQARIVFEELWES